MHVQEVTATSNCNPFCNVSERGFIHRNESLLSLSAENPQSELSRFVPADFLLYIISDVFTDISQTATLTMWLCSRCADFPSMPHQSVTEITSLFRWNDLP